MRAFSTIAAFAVTALVSTSALGQTGPNPKEVYVKSVSHGGTGCPQGTVGAYISDDGKVFTLSFDQYSATQQRGSDPNKARSFCNLTVDLNIPSGWSFSVAKFDYRGYANIDAGLQGVVQSSYRFAGGASSPILRSILVGPTAADYLKTDNLGLNATVWSPCNVQRALAVKSEVRLEGDRNKSGLLTVDTIDAEFKTIYALVWRRC
jgi:hypothetical protein